MEPSAPTFTDINKYAENPKTHTENNNSWKKGESYARIQEEEFQEFQEYNPNNRNIRNTDVIIIREQPNNDTGALAAACCLGTGLLMCNIL